jgi:hypothetical protein
MVYIYIYIYIYFFNLHAKDLSKWLEKSPTTPKLKNKKIPIQKIAKLQKK